LLRGGVRGETLFIWALSISTACPNHNDTNNQPHTQQVANAGGGEALIVDTAGRLLDRE